MKRWPSVNTKKEPHQITNLCLARVLPRAAQLASIRQMRRQVPHGSAGEYQADEHAGVSRQVSRGSVGEYEADEQAGVTRSAGEYKADEQAGVARLSWRLSVR